MHPAPTFTAQDLIFGTPLASVEEVAALPDESVIVLIKDNGAFISEDIYQKWGQWQNMDPSDRDDGERTYTPDDIVDIATLRDHRQIIHLWSPGDTDFGAPISEVSELADVPEHGIVLATRTSSLGSTDTTIFLRVWGSWMEFDPADRYDGEESLSDFDIQGYGDLRHIWSPPKPRGSTKS